MMSPMSNPWNAANGQRDCQQDRSPSGKNQPKSDEDERKKSYCNVIANNRRERGNPAVIVRSRSLFRTKFPPAPGPPQYSLYLALNILIW